MILLKLRLNRAQMVDDVLNLARGEKVNYDTALDLILYLKSENDFIPWSSALMNLGYIKDRLLKSTKENSDLFKSFVLDLLEERYQNLGFTPQENDVHLTILGRIGASSWMCGLDYEDCVQNAQDFFQKWMNDE